MATVLLILLFFSPFYINVSQALDRLDKTDCGVGKKVCLFSPADCDPQVDGSCDAAVVITESTEDADSVDIMMQRKMSAGPDYVAVGFSEDQTMGNDAVVHCIYGQGTMIQGLSYNPGYFNEILANAQVGVTIDGVLQNVAIATIGSDLICHSLRKIVPSILSPQPNDVEKIFDLNTPHYIFLAHGRASGSALSYHDRTPEISEMQYTFGTEDATLEL